MQRSTQDNLKNLAKDDKLLKDLRLEAAAGELDFDGWFLKESLTRWSNNLLT